jgi:hypothetical protein
MTMRRQYSLPNCTLILEGLSNGSGTTGQPDSRPLISILVNVECYFAGYEKPLTGGRDFFESLIRSVSRYAQEFLSGVPQPPAAEDKPEVVQLQKGDREDLHRLIVQPTTVADSTYAGVSPSHQTAVLQPTQVVLTTVQLFDLVDAVDQFLADSSTLPDLSLKLTPVSKRYAAAHEPISKRVVPAAFGVTSLAVAAIAFMLVPIPKVEPPKDPALQADALTQPPTPTPVSSSTSSPTASPTSSPTVSPTSSPSPTPSTAAAPSASELETLLTSVPEITDATELRVLQRKLYNQINQKWENRGSAGRNLVYRVGVGKDGAILAYKPELPTTNDQDQATPLAQLRYINPTTGTNPAPEAIAQFKVVFTKRGVLEVSPWWGYRGKPSFKTELSDTEQVQGLKQQLYDQIRKDWSGTPKFSRALVYRVAMNKDGNITDYEPYNQSAVDYEDDIPLPRLYQSKSSGAKVAQEPLAQFKVVFRPSGALEVSSWR